MRSPERMTPRTITGTARGSPGCLGAVGDNGKGVTGVAWQVQIMACKFIDRDGYGSTSDAIACIDFARTHGANIINASWGIYEFSTALSDAVSRAREAGIVFVAAAGNDSRNTDFVPYYPASFELDNVISVTATSRDDEWVFYSNFGAASVDLAAPGLNIFSTDAASDSAYATDEGTSMATPFVSGATALLLAKHPMESPRQLIQQILESTDPLPGLADKCRSGGRLNLQKALNTEFSLIVRPQTGSGLVEVGLYGQPNRTYVVQMSTNLVNWNPVFTNVTDATGKFSFTENAGTNQRERFYRGTVFTSEIP